MSRHIFYKRTVANNNFNGFCEKQAEEQTDISTTKSKDEPDRNEL